MREQAEDGPTIAPDATTTRTTAARTTAARTTVDWTAP